MSNLLFNGLEESASNFPKKVAISTDAESSTYSELWEDSSQVAIALLDRGVQKGERVGIFLGRSTTFVKSIYGILRLGAVYVPLDVRCPYERNKKIAQDCDISIIVSDESNLLAARKLGEACFAEVITITQCLELKTNREPNVSISQTDPAYILYTSGSTGSPKGVTHSHFSGLQFVNWAVKYFEVGSQDRVASISPFHFDLSTFDIFSSLSGGAEICLVPPAVSYLAVSFAEFLSQKKISIVYSVPTVFCRLGLSGELKKQNLRWLRLAIYAGEVFQFQHLNVLREQLASVRIVNLYGPTETNVVTYYDLSEAPFPLTEDVPIGKLCPYAKGHVADETCEKGELIVTSKSMMLGYWGKIKNSDDEKLYKTGDVVSKDGRGNFRFHGRIDGMVKSRGFRIELGEVEGALAMDESLLESAVVAFPDDQIGQKLKAFVVMREGASFDEKGIKFNCSQFVPPYMVPDDVIPIEGLPRTSTGKVDRIKLRGLT